MEGAPDFVQLSYDELMQRYQVERDKVKGLQQLNDHQKGTFAIMKVSVHMLQGQHDLLQKERDELAKEVHALKAEIVALQQQIKHQ